MSEFVSLTCPSCGGKLQIGNDVDRFACSYCGCEHVVKRSGGIVSLAPVIEEIRSVKNGVDKTASELAIKRLQEEQNKVRKSIPDDNPGCLGKIGNLFIVVALLALLYGFFSLLSGEESSLIIALVVFAVFLILGIVIANQNAKNRIERNRPYLEKIASLQSEINRHMEIVNNKDDH